MTGCAQAYVEHCNPTTSVYITYMTGWARAYVEHCNPTTRVDIIHTVRWILPTVADVSVELVDASCIITRGLVCGLQMIYSAAYYTTMTPAIYLSTAGPPFQFRPLHLLLPLGVRARFDHPTFPQLVGQPDRLVRLLLSLVLVHDDLTQRIGHGAPIPRIGAFLEFGADEFADVLEAHLGVLEETRPQFADLGVVVYPTFRISDDIGGGGGDYP